MIILITPYLISNEVIQDPSSGIANSVFSPPSLEHFFGTDRLGRDVFSRTLSGADVALKVVIISTSMSLLIGVPLGLVSGYFGGIFDKLISLLMDTLYTVPVILLAIVLTFLLGKGILNASIAMCIVYSPQYFRLIRNETIKTKSLDFVQSAKALGAGHYRVITKYIFGNVINSVPILLTLNAADSVLVLGGLGFLGLGIPESIPEWGADLQLSLNALPTGIWWTAFFPGLAMLGLVLALSLIGENLENHDC